MAELRTIFEGVFFAKSLGFLQIVVESNNNLAIDFISKKISPWTEVECLLELIWELIPSFREISFVYSPRGYNNVADKIVKFARLSGSFSTWMDTISDWICHLVNYDHLPLARVAL